MKILSEISALAPFKIESMRIRSAIAVVACSLVRLGFESHQVVTLLPRLHQIELASEFHRMISDSRTSTWFRDTLVQFHEEILADTESIKAGIHSNDPTSEDTILNQFNSIASNLCGKTVGESPDAEMDLIQILDNNYAHLICIAQQPQTQREIQAALWLRDLASFPRITPTTKYRLHAHNLIRLKLRMALNPRALGSYLISDPLVIIS